MTTRQCTLSDAYQLSRLLENYVLKHVCHQSGLRAFCQKVHSASFAWLGPCSCVLSRACRLEWRSAIQQPFLLAGLPGDHSAFDLCTTQHWGCSPGWCTHTSVYIPGSIAHASKELAIGIQDLGSCIVICPQHGCCSWCARHCCLCVLDTLTSGSFNHSMPSAVDQEGLMPGM